MPDSNAGKRGVLTVLKAITWIVYAFATAAIIILAFGFVLAMLGASTEAGFSAFIYEWSVRFIGPFEGMVAPTKTSAGFISWNALVAVAAYAVLAWLVGMVLDSISRSLGAARRASTAPAAQPQPTPAQAPAPTPVTPTPAPAPTAAPAPAPVAASEPEPAASPAAEPAPTDEPTQEA